MRVASPPLAILASAALSTLVLSACSGPSLNPPARLARHDPVFVGDWCAMPTATMEGCRASLLTLRGGQAMTGKLCERYGRDCIPFTRVDAELGVLSFSYSFDEAGTRHTVRGNFRYEARSGVLRGTLSSSRCACQVHRVFTRVGAVTSGTPGPKLYEKPGAKSAP